MHEHTVHLEQFLWPAGWLVAVLVLFVLGLSLPVDTRYSNWRRWFYAGGCVIAGLAVWVLANAALVLNDTHIDLTREKVYTPSAAAMAVVDELKTPVRLTYFYRSQDPAGRRTGEILSVMARRSPLLKVSVVDPDKQPDIARREGVLLYNAAIIEAAGRRILVQGTDEAQIAIGIQRVLRERAVTLCFIEGHGELAMDGFEYHSHLESATSHDHGDASSHVIETSGHGVGRLRRALEAQGYSARKLVLATSAGVPVDCTLVVIANPRTTFLPAESKALHAYLASGGNALILLDLGFEPEPGFAKLLEDMGVRPEQQVVVDPLSHYQSDVTMVAVTGYDKHPITHRISLTFFPGVRALTLTRPAAGVTTSPLMHSSRDSYTRPVAAAGHRRVDGVAGGDGAKPKAAPDIHPRALGVAAEGALTPGAPTFRAVIVGDSDFASNSFLPYMANSDFLLAAVRWLTREEQGTAVATRIPVPPTILLTGAQSRAILMTLVVLLPLSVVLLGSLMWWWRR